MSISGPAVPVWIVPDDELLRNGGTIAVQGGPAIPITNPPVDLLISTDASNQLEEGSDGKLFVPESGLGYLVYTALISQSGSGAPVATVLKNTLGATITWTRSGVGTYAGAVSAAVLTVNKTWCLPAFYTSFLNDFTEPEFIGLRRSTSSALSMNCRDAATFAGKDIDIGVLPIEIRVYP